MKTLCEGPPGMDWRGLNSLARAWALHPVEKPQVRTLPLDDRTYWQEVRKPMPELLPTSEVTARFVDGRTERMAARMAEIAQSVLREEPVCQMIAWAGKLHVDPNLRRASPYDPQTLRRTLGSELAGRADTPAYVCGQKGETLYDLIWRKGEEFQRRAEERERGRSQPERKAPPRESSAGDRKLPPVRVCAQTVQDFAARFRGVAEAMEAARGRATTPEEWAEARSRKPRQGLTPGQRLFLVTARQRNAWEHPPDLARQPIGVLRGAANAEVAAAAARLQEVPGRPAVSRGLVLAKADPERKERQAQALGRLSGVSRDGVDAREGGRREDPIWREAILSRIPELKHPAELSSEKLTPIDYSKTNWRVDRCRQAAREGR
ncbi:protein of unknown function [Methylacidimicrobium sp. AP8]|nr:protein of unknown function [Methylacidimicrobium sp. AP8]